ncbi:hypothetical protein HYH03_015670 [Edaphochlamys debaryana]|uniref:Protein kinase domain-containing protein n=1 Tax=Edaphochlamys debaryana TaxID=47281 RepID=A0A836BR06_9CHLO|nr:hypothetical protein HYH03_015670 [Edaphochlamys debaryana]|eukprot:KAG2485607.1 hypothetical protein HYH03_015670 [Edaphochlamys debaryana]
MSLLLWALLLAAHLYAGSSYEQEAVVRTGRELAAVLCNPQIAVARIASTHLALQDDDFAPLEGGQQAACAELPFTLKRNVTIQADDVDGPPWPLLQLTASHKVVLASGVNLTFRWVALQGYRARDNIISRPGFDLLSPSPPGTAGAVLVVTRLLAIHDVCYPPSTMDANFARVVRPPSLPGSQRWQLGLSQAGCVEGLTAGTNLSARCWAALMRIDDVGLTGADADAYDKPQPNNYVMLVQSVLVGCRMELTGECVESLGPIGCMRLAMSDVPSLPPLLPPDNTPGPSQQTEPGPNSDRASGPQPLNGSVALTGPGVENTYDARGSGGDDGSGPPVGLIVAGSVVGGVLVLAVVGFALWCHRRRALRADPYRTDPATKLEGGGELEEGAGQLEEAHSVVIAATFVAEPVEGNASAELPAVHEDLYDGGGVVVISPMTRMRSCKLCELQVLEAEESSPAVSVSLSESGGAMQLQAPPAVALTGRLLGKGAFGRVHEGVFLGQRVAVKQFAVQQGLAVGDPDEKMAELAMRSCVQELEILARCDHPNVVRLLAACVTGPRPVTVMELCDVSLAQLLYGRYRTDLMPLSLVLHIAAEMAKGLEYLHPTIVHRDLKPANVLINHPDSPLPEVKLADFGLSRIAATVCATETPEAGTPAYLAPECFDVSNFMVTQKADIYSWGVCVWEMLAGSKPWANLGLVAIAACVSLFGQRLPVPHGPTADEARWPPRLQRILYRVWDCSPERRPAAAELVKELALLQELDRRGLMWVGGAVLDRLRSTV